MTGGASTGPAHHDAGYLRYLTQTLAYLLSPISYPFHTTLYFYRELVYRWFNTYGIAYRALSCSSD